MALPPEIELGTHRLTLMAVSRNADDVLDARRGSDQTLTAFCFVGEVQAESLGSTAIAWYYSPLYQFERKKIRVDESVIADALTKAVAQRLEESAAGQSNRTVFVDAASGAASPSVLDAEDGGSGMERSNRRASLPALFLRLGKSTTFREYKPVAPAQRETKSEADGVEGEALRLDSSAERQPHIASPQLTPMLPRKPSLRLFSARFGSFSVRRPPLKREGLNNFMTVDAAGSPLHHLHPAATAASPLTLCAVEPVAAGTSEEEEEAHERAAVGTSSRDGDDAPSLTSTATAPVAMRSPRGSSNVLSVLRAPDTPLCRTPNSRSRKGMLHGPTGSSLSSAFLSTSNCPSGRVSRLPTSALSTARSPAVESDVRPTSSNAVFGINSARCSGDIPMLVREPLVLSSALLTADPHGVSGPAPPSSQRHRTPRRPPLLLHGGGRALSDNGCSNSGTTERTGDVEKTRARTPPAMHVS